MRAQKQEKTEYDVQAETFLKDTGTEIKCIYTGHRPYFADDKEFRATFRVTLQRGEKSMTFDFGQSIIESWIAKDGLHNRFRSANISGYTHRISVKKALKTGEEGKQEYFEVLRNTAIPSAYNLLTSIEKYDPESHQDFCDSYGYDTDSIKGRDIYLAVQEQYSKLSRLYNEVELEALREIQ